MYIGFRLDKSMILNMRVQRLAIVSCPDFLLQMPPAEQSINYHFCGRFQALLDLANTLKDV